jgi:hypothetical protein
MKTTVIVLTLLTISLGAVSAATSQIVNPSTNRNDFTGVVGYRFTSTTTATEINFVGFVGCRTNNLSPQK